MGTTFTNIHIRGKFGAENTLKAVSDRFIKEGYIAVGSDAADISLAVFEPLRGEWTSVYSDAFNGDMDAAGAAAKELSREFDADALTIGCLDSDCVCLNLINEREKIDIWANVGSAAQYGVKRRGNFNAWKCRVNDVEAFRAAANARYVFAEDSLDALTPIIHIPAAQSGGFIDTIDDAGLEGSISRAYFALQAAAKKEPPSFKHTQRSLNVCRPGERNCVFVVNTGGASRGVGVYFLSPAIGSGAIGFKDVELIRFPMGFNAQREILPLTLERVKLSNGRIALYASDENIRVPEGPSDKLPPKAYFEKLTEREIVLAFTPLGNARKFLEISVVLFPLANVAGQCSWNCWGVYSDKREFFANSRNQYKIEDYDIDEPFGARDPKVYSHRVH